MDILPRINLVNFDSGVRRCRAEGHHDFKELLKSLKFVSLFSFSIIV